MLLALLACSTLHESALAATEGQDIAAYLENQLGLNHVQARGSLGALLVFAREQLPKPQFDQLATRFPNAEILMENVKAQGIVTRPLDDISGYEKSLEALNISETVAAQIPPAVVQYLGDIGYDEEQAILQGILR